MKKRCIDGSGHYVSRLITAGNDYEILAENDGNILVICDDGFKGSFKSSRFETIVDCSQDKCKATHFTCDTRNPLPEEIS